MLVIKINSVPSINNELARLQKNGGNFKSQKIGIKLQNGEKSIGKLDWNKKRQYIINEVNCIEIPFVFQNIGEKIPMDTFVAYATYHLVIRNYSTASLQFYYSLNGEPINSYMKQNSRSKVHNIRISSVDSGISNFKNFSIKRNSSWQGGHGLIMLAHPDVTPGLLFMRCFMPFLIKKMTFF